MNASTKKIIVYSFVALASGGVIYFIASFFKKDSITVGNTTVELDSEEKETIPAQLQIKNNFFADKLAESQETMKELWSSK